MIVNEEELSNLETFMTKENIQRHTLRRSGLRFHKTLGLSDPQLMSLSLHTSTQTLNMYLEN